jgi:hypothetical protein
MIQRTIFIRKYIIGVSIVLIEICNAGFARWNKGSGIWCAADTLWLRGFVDYRVLSRMKLFA